MNLRTALMHGSLAFSIGLAGGIGSAADEAKVTLFSTATVGGNLPAPWHVVTLPKIPRHTRYSVVKLDGEVVVKAEADASYGNAVHQLQVDAASQPVLRWRWRVDKVPAGSDLRRKEGDDLAAKVCVLFDLPLDRLSFADRIRVELGRQIFDPELPAATICYLWDRTTPSGTWLPNVYTDRVRMLVLRSAAAGGLGLWAIERRDLRADFAQAFPREAAGGIPPISAIAIATDGDNTGSSALAYFGDISLARE